MPTTAVITATTTLSTISNLASAITLWPSSSSTSVNLFVTRSWPKPHNKGNTQMSVPEEKQKVRALDLSKYKILPAREITASPTSTFSHTELYHCQKHGSHEYTIPSKKVQEMGPIMLILCPICPTPLSSGIRLVRGGLGQ